MDGNTLPASNVVTLRPGRHRAAHAHHHALIRAADVRTLRALARYQGQEGDEARAELKSRGEPRAAVEIAQSMLGHANRITVLLGGAPDADAILGGRS